MKSSIHILILLHVATFYCKGYADHDHHNHENADKRHLHVEIAKDVKETNEFEVKTKKTIQQMNQMIKIFIVTIQRSFL